MNNVCNHMILTPSPEHNGGVYCAETLPCKYHTKGEDGLSDVDRELQRKSAEMNRHRTFLADLIKKAIAEQRTLAHAGKLETIQSMDDFLEAKIREAYREGLEDGLALASTLKSKQK